MKRFIMFFCMILCSITMIFAQGSEVEVPDYAQGFETFTALVAITPIVTEFIKRFIPNMNGIWTQVTSWIIAIVVSMFGWYFNLGFLADINWWQALLYGIGAGLASNGIASTGLVEWLVNLIIKKKVSE